MNYISIIALLLVFAVRPLSAQKFWLTTYEFPDGPKVAMAGSDDSVLVVSTTTYLLRSTNGGNSFVRLNDQTTEALYFTRSRTLLAGGTSIRYSYDAGTTWNTAENAIQSVTYRFHQTKDGDLFALTTEGILYSHNDGLSWQQRNAGLTAYKNCTNITSDKNGRLYVGCFDAGSTGIGGIYISDDNGISWQQLTITIDGRGVIESTVIAENVTSVEVTPQDSLIVSIAGAVRDAGSGVAVRLNVIKHINDVMNTDHWIVRKVGFSATWWLDQNLNNIHFAHNGDWYSSTDGTPKFGGTMFSKDMGQTWTRLDYGLGLSTDGDRKEQFFYETSAGKVYMIQFLDERIYWADTSKLSVHPDNDGLRADFYPQAVRPGELLRINDVPANDTYTITDILGRIVTPSSKNTYTSAPKEQGIYFIHFLSGKSLKFIVY